MILLVEVAVIIAKSASGPTALFDLNFSVERGFAEPLLLQFFAP